MVSSPVDFSDTAWSAGAPVPELGQHIEEILPDLSYDWGRIADRKKKRVIP